MKTHRFTLEHALYILAFAIALLVRFLHLGAAPLSDYEAEWALKAWQVSRGETVAFGSIPGYVSLTGMSFFTLGHSNALARFWPAVAGSLVVWLPFLLRRRLGRLAPLIMAFGLAVDPGLVALSRLAGGPMMAMGFAIAAFGLWYARSPLLAGVVGGLSFLGGPAFFHGMVGLALAWSAILGLLRVDSGETNEEHFFSPFGETRESLKIALMAFVGTVLLISTLFLSFPQGLGGVGEAAVEYFRGWLLPAGVPSLRLLSALVFYQPLALVFGFIAAVRGWIDGETLPRRLSLWFVAVLAVSLLYPGRQVGDVAWALLPLWGLAAIEMARYFRVESSQKIPVLILATLILLLLALGWFNLSGLARQPVDSELERLRWGVVGGSILLSLIASGLVALGWSPDIARRGLAWGAGFALGLYVLASLWGVSQLRPNGESELWSPHPVTHQADLLMNTLGDLAQWRTGDRSTLDLVVTTPAPSLRWVLLEWNEARFITNPAPGELPTAIITTAARQLPGLSVAYRGQDFSWWIYPAWDGGLPPDWLRWMVFRQAPQNRDYIILWARGDVFPDGTLTRLDESQLPLEDGLTPDDEDLIPERGIIE